MFKETKVRSALVLAFGGGLAIAALPSVAQEQLERVEVTGSAIKRIASETALPIQVITRKDIEKSGATNTNDLLQRLPAMQNSTVEGSAVGGETFGFGGVSIHSIGETRTLVLLNGHRVAKFGGQAVTGALNGIDINTLPLASIERIEILTDGASALYGADAVAGVVNFITIKKGTEGSISAGASFPTLGNAREQRVSLTKGFGDYSADGFNAQIAISLDKRSKLSATDRDFAKSGIVRYTDEQGELLGPNLANATSKRGIPANLNLYDAAGDQVVRLNPFLDANGVCPPFHVKSGTSCRYDFTSQLEIYPDRERTNAFLSFDKAIGSGMKWSTELLLGKTKSTARIAPPPGELPIQVGSAAYNQAIALAQKNGYYPIGTTPPGGDPANEFDPATMDANLRFTELGKRTNINEVRMAHFVTSLEGTFADWDYTTSFTHSQNTAKDTFGGGYASVSGVLAATSATSQFNPFLQFGQQSAAGKAAIDNAKISGYWNGGKSTLDMLSVQASGELAKLAGGPLQLAVGGSFQREVLDARTGPILGGRVTFGVDVDGNPCTFTGKPCVGTAIDQRFGDSGIQPAYKASRKTAGVFAELGAPVSKTLELTTSARFDKTSVFGNSANGKIAARFQPAKELLFRSSIGTGYIAPSIAQINAPLQNFGVTQDAYSCSGTPAENALQTLATQLGNTCEDGAQFNQFAQGSAKVKPEKSKQLTLGIAVEPTANLTFSADFWTVHISDAIGQKTEQVVFADPLKYSQYFTTFVDPATGKKLLAFYTPNENLGNAVYTGIDFNVSSRVGIFDGKLATSLVATYMLKSAQQQEKGGAYFSDIGGKDDQASVTFKWQGKLINTFESGPWSHTLGLNYKSGFLDSATTPTIFSGAGGTKPDYRVSVKPYYTFDWATTFATEKGNSFTVGVLNLDNKKPPFVFSQGGLSRGQEVGWDGRYYDPRGRTLYLNGTVKF